MSAATRIFQRRRRRRALRKSRQQRLGLGLGALLLATALLVMLPAGGAWWMYQNALAALPPLPTGGQAAPAAGPVSLLRSQRRNPAAQRARSYERRNALADAGGVAGTPGDGHPADGRPRLPEAPGTLPRDHCTAPVAESHRSPLPPEQTLTLRLVRNFYAPPVAPPAALTREREIVLAAELERLHSREALLEWASEHQPLRQRSLGH